MYKCLSIPPPVSRARARARRGIRERYKNNEETPELSESESENAEAREVKVGTVDLVREAIERTPVLQWSPEIEQLCGKQGHLCREDHDDGTAEVSFDTIEYPMQAWLPLSILTDVTTEVCSIEDLQTAIEAHSALKWHERLADTCGKTGLVLEGDIDGISHVKFPCLNNMKVWLPTKCLIMNETPETEKTTKRQKDTESEKVGEKSTSKRQRTSE